MKFTKALAISVIGLLATINVNAAIMGLLYEQPGQSVRYAIRNGYVEIQLVGFSDLPSVTLSRYLPGDGGDVFSLMQALQRNEPAPFNSLAGWMASDASQKETLKYGIFYPDHSMEYDSFFTGTKRRVPHLVVNRTSMEHEPNISSVQTFSFRPEKLLIDEIENANFLGGIIDLGIVTQSILKNDMDVTLREKRITADLLKTNAELGGSFDSEFDAKSCNSLLGESKK